MVHLMPGLTSAEFKDTSTVAAWFRLSPSAAYIACALAKRMLADGITKASVVVDPDDYSSNFATRFGRAFSTQGGTVLPSMQVAASGTSYADTIETVVRMSPDASVLVASPSVAAGFLQEWAVRSKPIKLYLGPTLNTPELLRNVPVGILDGMTGVSADLGDRAADFDAYFQAQTEVLPITGSHYYYDAVALLSLAAAEGIAQTGNIPDPAAMKYHMFNVSSASGTMVSFDQLAQGLQLLAAGQKIQYYGAAGAYVLDSFGDSTQNRGVIWQISGADFETVDYQQCTLMEVRGGET
jgi:branched-chain amino acid transport system substrate-binding protein